MRFGRRKRRDTRPPRSRRASIEQLEQRNLFAAAPFGAHPDDTGEILMGDVYVNVVFMESDGTSDPDTETWTNAHRDAVKAKIDASVQWWIDTLRKTETTHAHPLNFTVDYTHADAPVSTTKEPITNISDEFSVWMYDFLDVVGHNKAGSFSADIRSYNNAQREANDADWSFTIFVVNSDNDSDDAFAAGGSFLRAFAYAGGRFFVVPSGRPTSSYTHELGHMFWARDEYSGGGTYTQRRGYYNTQNLNAADNPAPGFVQADSIMTNGAKLNNAFANNTSSPTSLEMIGWKDSDGDGIFDVVDRPHSLTGTGFYDQDDGVYRFRGQSAVDALPNQNPSGLQNDITINHLRRAEYRLDGTGDWQLAESLDSSSVELDLAIPVPADFQTIEIRTFDNETGIASAVYLGGPGAGSSMLMPGINGFVFNDVDEDGQREQGEPGLAGWTVQVVDGNGDPLDLDRDITPSNLAVNTNVDTIIPEATLSGFGAGLALNSVVIKDPNNDGNHVFGNFVSNTSTTTLWTPTSKTLRIDFTSPVSSVSITALGDTADDYGRLEIFDINGELLDRYTTAELAAGQTEVMRMNWDTAEIDHAIARGHHSSIRLTDLHFGASSTVTTDVYGAYSIPYLLPGDYTVTSVAPRQDLPDATPGTIDVSLSSGEQLSGIDFATKLEILWQNPVEPMDVDDDGHVAPIDALYVINELNENGARQLPLDGSEIPPPHYDVDGDGHISPSDALVIINQLNGGEAEGESGGRLVQATAANDAGQAEGEAAVEEPARLPDVAGLAQPADDFFAAYDPQSERLHTVLDRDLGDAEDPTDLLEYLAGQSWLPL